MIIYLLWEKIDKSIQKINLIKEKLTIIRKA